MCAAPIGNDFGKGHGRPPDLGVQLRKLADAAAKVDNLLGELGLQLNLQRDLAPSLAREAHIAALHEEISAAQLALTGQTSTILALAKAAKQLLEERPLVKGGRRRKRRHAPDPWDVEVMAAAASLDRLLPEGEA